MKKLLSVAFIMVAMLFVTSSADAQNRGNRGNGNGRYAQNNNRVVRTYTQTKVVRIRGQRYRETYRVTVFRNGRTTSKLINRVQVNNRRGNNRNNRGFTNTYNQTKVIWENGRRYRATYQVTQHRNGRQTVRLIQKVRIR